MLFQHAFSCAFLGSTQFGINHFSTAACWVSAYLHIHLKNVWESLRTGEPPGPRGRRCDSSSEKASCIKQGEITNSSAIVSSGTILFFKSQVKGRVISWCEEYSLTSRVLLCVTRLVSKEHLFSGMDLDLCFPLLQEMYLYKLQNNFALLLVVIAHFVMQYINFSDTLMSN